MLLLEGSAANQPFFMLLRRGPDIPSSEITDEQLYLRRREFIRLAGSAAISAAAGGLVAACGADTLSAGGAQATLSGIKPKVVTTDEKWNTFEEITSYNNFYEFGTGKDDPEIGRASCRERV